MIKKLVTISIACLISGQVYAASSATAIFTNFNVSVLSGEALEPIFETYSASVNNNVVSAGFQNSVYEFQNSQLPANIVLNTVLGGNSARSSVIADGLNWTFESLSNTSAGFADSSIFSNMFFQYKANSLLRISGDAVISGFGISASGERADSNVTLSLYSSSFDNAFLTNNYSSSLSAGIGFGQNYSVSRKLQFYFYDDKDLNLQINVSTLASTGSFTQPVPEPTTYGMLICGLGLLCLNSRRKLVKNS